MAVEQKRGCGFRKVGGLYLVSDGIMSICDRLPYQLCVCPVCGEGLQPTRSMKKINPKKLFGDHDDMNCNCNSWCVMCFPPDEPHYMMGVGKGPYPTPEHFVVEGLAQGVSKRIKSIPKNFIIGKTWVYLSHPLAIMVNVPFPVQYARNYVNSQSDGAQLHIPDIELPETERQPGIFAVFRPKRIEKLIWASEATEETIEKLEKRGITPVIIPDGDKDHA